MYEQSSRKRDRESECENEYFDAVHDNNKIILWVLINIGTLESASNPYARYSSRIIVFSPIPKTV